MFEEEINKIVSKIYHKLSKPIKNPISFGLESIDDFLNLQQPQVIYWYFPDEMSFNISLMEFYKNRSENIDIEFIDIDDSIIKIHVFDQNNNFDYQNEHNFTLIKDYLLNLLKFENKSTAQYIFFTLNLSWLNYAKEYFIDNYLNFVTFLKILSKENKCSFLIFDQVHKDQDYNWWDELDYKDDFDSIIYSRVFRKTLNKFNIICDIQKNRFGPVSRGNIYDYYFKSDINGLINSFRDDFGIKNIKSGIVYLIHDTTGNYKIGITKNLTSRLQGLQTSNPNKLEIVIAKYVLGYKTIESMLHEKFKKQHLNGEWFKLNGEHILFIKQLLKKYEVEL